MNPRLRSVLFIAALAAPASSQVTLTLVSCSGSASAAGSSYSGACPAFASGINRYFCIENAAADVSIGGLTATASASVSQSPNPFGCSYITPGNSASAIATVRFSSPVPIAGTIVGTPGPNSPGASFASASVGSLSVVIDASGFEVSLNARAVGFGGTSASVTFTPAAGQLTTSFTPCGPSLTATVEDVAGGTSLEFEAAGAPVTQFGFFVFGFTPINVSIPPLGCVLGTTIDVASPMAVSAAGTAALSLVTPPPGGSLTALVQFLAGEVEPDGSTTWSISNRIDVAFP